MNINSQIQSNRLKILMIFIISIFLISLVLLLRIWKGVPIGHLTRDINAIAKVPFYTGFFSQIGFFFWGATAAMCIFSANMISKCQEIITLKRFLFLSGLLTMLLGFDDMFLLHEKVFPYYLGIPQKIVYTIYGILVIFLLVKYYSIIFNTDYILLAMAFFFFGLSVILDLFPIPGFNRFLLEDSSKMVGIVSWFFYYHSNAVDAISYQKE